MALEFAVYGIRIGFIQQNVAKCKEKQGNYEAEEGNLQALWASFCGLADVISSKMASESAIRGNIGSKMRQEAAASAIRGSIKHLNQQNIAKCKENE